jgi:predicted ATP-dependent endonuclease of OLD family
MPKLDYTINGNSLSLKEELDLPKYTILVGKNNTGKSWLLTTLYNKLQQNQTPYNAYYVSPERFGELQRDTQHEDISYSNRIGKDKEKIKNQSADFITDSISSFNALIAQLNRDQTKNKPTLDLFLKNLNDKIPNITFSYTDSSESTSLNFKVNGKYLSPGIDKFSSGTNQIIALMTCIMYFLYSNKYADDAMLLLDEPDVHIHPDLQVQFISFLISSLKDTKHKIIIATHSSSIISGFSKIQDTFIATRKDDGLNFTPLNEYLEKILPSLGSHSLSHVFNKSPLLLIEGVDDEMVWQYAIRKSGGKIKFHLVEVGGKDYFPKYEKLVNDISIQLFDRPISYEIRDRDVYIEGEKRGKLVEEELNDIGIIKVARLRCREIENLIMSNEVLAKFGTDWEKIKKELEEKFGVVDRYSEDIERNKYNIIKILNENNGKSWEVIVGNTIGENIDNISILKDKEGSIYYMLGEKVCSFLV